MPELFLTLNDIAERAGITVGAARQAHKRAASNRASGSPLPSDMPAEDVRLGLTPGWREDSVRGWIERRSQQSPQR